MDKLHINHQSLFVLGLGLQLTVIFIIDSLKIICTINQLIIYFIVSKKCEICSFQFPGAQCDIFKLFSFGPCI